MSVEVELLEDYLAELLNVDRIQDSCPNGLQVAGERPVGQLASAVSASLASIEEAAARGADALLVHHGLFWDRQPGVLRGSHRARVARLLDSGMSLLAYHLPLDNHPELGHGACIARSLGLVEPLQPFGAYRGLHLGWQSELPEAIPLEIFLSRVDALLGPGLRRHLFGPDPVKRVAVASGDCPFLLREAALEKAHVLVTGEETEFVQELAREEGVHFLAQGHYRTEVPGVKALASHIAERFGLRWCFIDVPNEA